MAGWHHWLDGRESQWTPGVGDGQGGLVCCDSWGRKESDTTKRLIWSEETWRHLPALRGHLPVEEGTALPPFASFVGLLFRSNGAVAMEGVGGHRPLCPNPRSLFRCAASFLYAINRKGRWITANRYSSSDTSGLAVTCYGIVHIAGEFKDMDATSELKNKTFDTLRNHPSFYVFNHRGRVLFRPSDTTNSSNQDVLSSNTSLKLRKLESLHR